VQFAGSVPRVCRLFWVVCLVWGVFFFFFFFFVSLCVWFFGFFCFLFFVLFLCFCFPFFFVPCAYPQVSKPSTQELTVPHRSLSPEKAIVLSPRIIDWRASAFFHACDRPDRLLASPFLPSRIHPLRSVLNDGPLLIASLCSVNSLWLCSLPHLIAL